MHKIRPVKVEPLISTTDIKFGLKCMALGAVLALIYLVMEGRV